MDFRFTPEQEQFRDSVRRFAEKHLAKSAHERAHSPEYPWDVAKLMAGQGLLGITVAEADGGQGGTLIDAVIAIETVASVCPRSADVVQAGNFGPIRVLAEYGTPGQKEKYLKPLLTGESVISVGGGDRDRQGVLQPGGVRRRERGAAGDGRSRLHEGGAGRVLPAPLPRLDDRRRLDRDPQEPHRGSRVRAQLFAAAGFSSLATTRLEFPPAPAEVSDLRHNSIARR